MAAAFAVEVVDHLDEREIHEITQLINKATEVDQVRPVSEHVWLHIRHGGDHADRHLLVRVNGHVVGYAHLDETDLVAGPSAELAVDPSHRHLGIGRALVATLIDLVPGGHLRLWSHGELAASGELALSMGFTQARVLWQMRRSLFAPLPSMELPEGVSIRSFRPGIDDEEWLAVNTAAFAELPDQGSWTLEDLHRRMAEPWFDENGFLIAEETGKQSDGQTRIVGFHWTKQHGGPAHELIGEVYVVAVDPAFTGKGLGRALTLAGLHHLRAAGLAQVMLYVDSTNDPAIRLYQDLGFARWDTDVMFRR